MDKARDMKFRRIYDIESFLKVLNGYSASRYARGARAGAWTHKCLF